MTTHRRLLTLIMLGNLVAMVLIAVTARPSLNDWNIVVRGGLALGIVGVATGWMAQGTSWLAFRFLGLLSWTWLVRPYGGVRWSDPFFLLFLTDSLAGWSLFEILRLTGWRFFSLEIDGFSGNRQTSSRQFSLRELLILTAVAAVWLAYVQDMEPRWSELLWLTIMFAPPIPLTFWAVLSPGPIWWKVVFVQVSWSAGTWLLCAAVDAPWQFAGVSAVESAWLTVNFLVLRLAGFRYERVVKAIP